jgi:hypothetical protein
MIVLGRIEIPAWLGFSDDRAIEHMRLVELDDVRLSDAHLFRICRENCRAILRPDIRPLAVELSRIVDDREIAADRPEPTYRISNRQNRIGTHAGRQPECRLRFLLAGHALEKFSGTVQRRGVLLGA